MELNSGEQKVLTTLYKLQQETGISIDDRRIADTAQLLVEDVCDWIETLADKGFVERHRTTNGIAASITANGRLELRLNRLSPLAKPAEALDIQDELQSLNNTSGNHVANTAVVRSLFQEVLKN
jgi:CTP-dependent riboflavin kinase